MAAHSSILAWRTPWTEEIGGLQSVGSQRVGNHQAATLSLKYYFYQLSVSRRICVKEGNVIGASKGTDQNSWLAVMDDKEHLPLGGKNLS